MPAPDKTTMPVSETTTTGVSDATTMRVSDTTTMRVSDTTTMRVSDTTAMIAGMTPNLQPGRWVYCHTVNATQIPSDAFAFVREQEGATLILPYDTAKAAGYDVSVAMALITLDVYSDLEGVGLTAAVATALTQHNISCNVVAAYHHDHVFVAQKDADRAVSILRDVQQNAQAKSQGTQET